MNPNSHVQLTVLLRVLSAELSWLVTAASLNIPLSDTQNSDTHGWAKNHQIVELSNLVEAGLNEKSLAKETLKNMNLNNVFLSIYLFILKP